jgi:uncharacterized protein DUF3592
MDLSIIPALVGSVGVAVHSLAQLVRSARARNWPSVEGQIVRSQLVGRHATITVRYRYRVNDRLYHNDVVRFGWATASYPSTIRGLDATINHPDRLPLAATVFYNPVRPEDSVLNPAPHFMVWIGLIFGGLVAYIVLGLP